MHVYVLSLIFFSAHPLHIVVDAGDKRQDQASDGSEHTW